MTFIRVPRMRFPACPDSTAPGSSCSRCRYAIVRAMRLAALVDAPRRPMSPEHGLVCGLSPVKLPVPVWSPIAENVQWSGPLKQLRV